MKRLILMRHAKSSWATPGQDDHARPLDGRGKVSTRVLGEWLAHNGYLPDQTLSSNSVRTRETFARLKIVCDAEFLGDLYHAGPEDMLRVLRKATDETVLMLGHNPGIGWFAQTLVAVPPPHPRFFDYPTGATLVAEFDIDTWEEVGTGTGKAVDFVIPRELTG